MKMEENLRTTPSKGSRPGSSSSPSTRSNPKKGTKNAKITNFFTKINSPLARNNSNSNVDLADDSNGDGSSSSMKAPQSIGIDEIGRNGATNKDYVFIVPSSDDDTNVSTKGSQSSKRKKPPSLHSSNSKSSDGFVLTSTNNELGIARKKRVLDLMGGSDTNSNQDGTLTPSRGSSRDSTPTNSAQKINRIQPTRIGCRTKMIDFQSVPSDLNLPRDQAERLIEKLFFFSMPDDFYLFWEFAKTINHRKPCSAFSQAFLDWNLVGPYDVLSGLITDFHGFNREDLLRHCRFYYDPPEFQTVVIKKDDQMTHYGYFRDCPTQEKAIVVLNKASHGAKLYEVGDNLFTALNKALETAIAVLSKSSQDIPPFCSSSSQTSRSIKTKNEKDTQLERAKAKQELTIIRDKLFDFCSSHKDLNPDSWCTTDTRRLNRSSRGFNDIGIVTPRQDKYNHHDLGVSEGEKIALLGRISELKDCDSTPYKDLQRLIGIVNAAYKDGDFGLGLQLGLDLFSHGDSFFHRDIEILLSNAYTQLKRTAFIDILKSHLSDRKKGDKVSLLD